MELSLENYKQPNILFLRGCFLSKCTSIEDMFDEQLLSGISDVESRSKSANIPDKLPVSFNGVKDWVKSINIKCWSCDCTFHTVPLFIPLSITSSGDPVRISMDTFGNFCSWNCASLHIETYQKSNNRWESREMLKFLYKCFTGDKISEILPAMSKTNMKQYGGDMTIQEYRSKLQELSISNIQL